MLEPAEVKRWERLTDAMLAHAAADDPEAFAQVVRVLERAAAKLPAVAAALVTTGDDADVRPLPGYSWADLARALGTTRQAAHKRFSRRAHPDA